MRPSSRTAVALVAQLGDRGVDAGSSEVVELEPLHDRPCTVLGGDGKPLMSPSSAPYEPSEQTAMLTQSPSAVPSAQSCT